jgi:exopolysaccharide biosynthesis polyprenyl glycosylphosphotransferase
VDRLEVDDVEVGPSRLQHVAELVHGSRFHPLPMLVDAAVLATVARLTGASSGLAAAILLLVPVGVLGGLYRRRSCLETQGVVWYARAAVVPFAVAAAILAVLHPASADRAEVVRTVTIAGSSLVGVRLGLWIWIAACRRHGQGLLPTLLSGPAPAVVQVLRRISAFPECGLRVTAVHTPVERPDQRSAARGASLPDGRGHKRVLDLIDRRQVDAVLLISAGGDCGTYDEIVHRGDGSGIEYNVVVPFTRLATSHGRARVGDLGILPLGQVNYRARLMPGKRLFDIVAASAMLLVMLPMLAIIAAAVKLSDRGPAFYGQLRVGRDGRLFKMWKFRSMVVGADKLVDQHRDQNINDGLLFKVEDDPRITRVGNILRRMSLDELPQVINVLKGDMSFVGPRPLPVEPEEFDEVATKRHSVRPGITGPWQVHGGHALSYEDMVALDLGYISGWSFRKDLWILLLTLPALLIRRAPVI